MSEKPNVNYRFNSILEKRDDGRFEFRVYAGGILYYLDLEQINELAALFARHARAPNDDPRCRRGE